MQTASDPYATPMLGPADLARLRALARGCDFPPQSPPWIEAAAHGDRLARITGSGLELEELRPYQPDDELRRIDPRASQRLGRPIVRVYREEQLPSAYAVCDAGSSMRFGTRGGLKLAQAARVSALFGIAAARHGFAVGGERADAGGRIDPVPPRTGDAHLARWLARLAEPAPPLADDGGRALASALQALARRVPAGAFVLIASDWRFLDAVLEATLAELARRTHLRAVGIQDAAEYALPDVGQQRFGRDADAVPMTLATGDSAVQATTAGELAAQRERAGRRLARHGVVLHWFAPGIDCAERLCQLLRWNPTSR